MRAILVISVFSVIKSVYGVPPINFGVKYDVKEGGACGGNAQGPWCEEGLKCIGQGTDSQGKCEQKPVCHFSIGYGARAIPCCLSIISQEEYEKERGPGFAGGDKGKHHRCPKDANEAHELIQKMESGNVEGSGNVEEYGTQKEGEVCGSCFNPDTNFDCGKCIQGLQCIKDPQSDLLPDLPSKCGVASSIEIKEKQIGEDCGPCLAPDLNYDCGTCADGLTCEGNPLLPDAPGTCVILLIPTESLGSCSSIFDCCPIQDEGCSFECDNGTCRNIESAIENTVVCPGFSFEDNTYCDCDPDSDCGEPMCSCPEAKACCANKAIEPTDSTTCHFAIGYGARMIPCCLSIISREEYENRLGAGLVGGDQGKHHRCPNDANEAHELIQKMESNTCHFAIGYGARMAPCCLSIISREEYENRLEGGLVGGDQGKHHRCPNDANEAHELIQKMETNNKKGVDCDLCVSDFAASRGCECMAEPDCDVTAIIPQGCISCGNKAMEYCDKQTGPTTDAGWETYCAAQEEYVEGCVEFTVSLVYTANTTCKKQAAADSGFWWPEQTLRKPVGRCTKNVIGNTVIFRCDPTQGVIMEDVYHDVLDGSKCNGLQCTCESDIKYTLPIKNGCSEQFFGGMHMVWDDFCQAPTTSVDHSNVFDECGEGCGEGSCCIEWNFYQINDPELPYFANIGITPDFIRKTCSDAKSSALMSQYAVEGKDYAEVNMIESTNFYMNWENFAPTYRSEYCEFSGIDPAACVNYTEEDMVEHVWGGRENAEATKYRVGPLCSKSGQLTLCKNPGNSVPSPHDSCNTCQCREDGTLGGCTRRFCLEASTTDNNPYNKLLYCATNDPNYCEEKTDGEFSFCHSLPKPSCVVDGNVVQNCYGVCVPDSYCDENKPCESIGNTESGQLSSRCSNGKCVFASAILIA